MKSKYLMTFSAGVMVGAFFKGLLITGALLFLAGSAWFAWLKYGKSRVKN